LCKKLIKRQKIRFYIAQSTDKGMISPMKTSSKWLTLPTILILVACAVVAFVVSVAVNIGKVKRANEQADQLSYVQQQQILSLKENAVSGRYGDYLAGRSASISGDHQQATAYLKSIKDVKEIKNDIAPLLLQQSLLVGDMGEAIDAATRTFADNNYHPIAALTLAVHQLKTGDVGTAKTTIKQIEPYGLYMLIYPFMHSWFEFSPTAPIIPLVDENGLQHKSYNAMQHYHEGLQHVLRQDKEKALASFARAVDHPKTTLDMTLFGVMHYYSQVQEADKAIALYNSVQKARPRSPLWHILPAEKAIPNIADDKDFKITAVQDGIAQALVQLAILLYQEGASQDAIQLATLAHYLASNNQSIAFSLAHLLETDAQYDRVIALYDSVTNNSILKASASVERARILYLSERDDEAIASLLSNTQHDGTAYQRFTILGDIARINEEHKKAAQYYSQAITTLALQKSDWEIIYKRGIAYDVAGEWDKAEADFNHALQLKPDQPEVTNYLAYSWLVRGQHVEKAEALLKKAVEKRPDSAHIIDSYGWALYKLQRYDEALTLIERALALLPSDPTINDHYGDILWQLGRRTEAQYQWKRALVFEPKEQSEVKAIELKIEQGLKTASPKV
jgi:tetratricopeptide (TPR) repeat protein